MSTRASILIVDDDFGARTIVRTILTANNFAVTEAVNGTEAVEILKTKTFDLIVLDIMMPGLSGYDVMVHLRQRVETQNIPVIMLTAKSETADVLTGYRDYAVDYYITKPFTSAQLLQGIALVLGLEDDKAEAEEEKDQAP